MTSPENRPVRFVGSPSYVGFLSMLLLHVCLLQVTQDSCICTLDISSPFENLVRRSKDVNSFSFVMLEPLFVRFARYKFCNT
jgi:hypothetical protein